MHPLSGEGVDGVRTIIATLAGVAVLATLAMLAGLTLDLRIAQLFYDPAQQRFIAAINPYVAAVRDNGLIALVTCMSVVVAALVTRMLRLPQKVIPGRVVIFLVGTLALGPGLLVNGILKEHWHRPRPVHVTEFGGNRAYVDWWNPGGSCERNCSFVSGEVASAAWMFAPAMLAPPQWRLAAFVGASVFTLAISLSRMAAGGHFFTDVLFAALLMTILIWVMHRVIFRWRQSPAVIA
ncbi:MAG: lipid 4-phosphatase [Alphaproteobacteria bacterium]|jgi:membrane-associated PAP2 superfamily phosphatase|nr:lipid 4-phosphatase [Alphaproteobacteria bacterium]